MHSAAQSAGRMSRRGPLRQPRGSGTKGEKARGSTGAGEGPRFQRTPFAWPPLRLGESAGERVEAIAVVDVGLWLPAVLADRLLADELRRACAPLRCVLTNGDLGTVRR